MSYFNSSPIYVDPKRPRKGWITAQSLSYDWGLTPEYVEQHRKAGVFEGLTRYDHHRNRWLYHSEAIEVLMVEPTRPLAKRICICDGYGEND
jgi:hypothetical protein